VADLRAAVPVLLQLLGDLAQRAAARPLLQEMGVREAVRKLLPWRRAQVRCPWRVGRERDRQLTGRTPGFALADHRPLCLTTCAFGPKRIVGTAGA
jgi:hypothetical protein